MSDDGIWAKTMLNRRDLVKGAVMVPLAAQELWPQRAAAEEKRRCLLIGTQTETGSSKGIYAGEWDPGAGEIRDVVLAAESDNPTFLALSPDGKYLYAANEISSFAGRPSGAVSGFAVDATARKLRPINQVASMGTGTCYVSVDHAGRVAFCANYTGGSASSFYLS